MAKKTAKTPKASKATKATKAGPAPKLSEKEAREKAWADVLKANDLTPEQFVALLLHPLCAALGERIWVSPDNQDVALDARVMEMVETKLKELAGKGDEFFVAYQQVMNLGFALHKTYPSSVAPAEIISMLDRVAVDAMPKLRQEEIEATQAVSDKVGNKFRDFVGKGEGEKIKDTGARVKQVQLPRNIKG